MDQIRGAFDDEYRLVMAELSFQHRDLHKGQILVSAQIPPINSDADNYLLTQGSPVRVTIIDFGLSRLDMDKSVWTPIPQEVYEGVGAQWDMYREMRDRVDGDWEAFHPITNVLVEFVASIDVAFLLMRL